MHGAFGDEKEAEGISPVRFMHLLCWQSADPGQIEIRTYTDHTAYINGAIHVFETQMMCSIFHSQCKIPFQLDPLVLSLITASLITAINALAAYLVTSWRSFLQVDSRISPNPNPCGFGPLSISSQATSAPAALLVNLRVLTFCRAAVMHLHTRMAVLPLWRLSFYLFATNGWRLPFG